MQYYYSSQTLFEGEMTESFNQNVNALAVQNGLAEDMVAVCNLDEIEIESIQKAVVFYHGAWSGPSVVVLKILIKVISDFGPLKLIVVNADQLNSDYRKEDLEKARILFGPVISAWGETCWILEGKIYHQDILWWKDSDEARKFSKSGEYNRRIQASADEIRTLIKERIELLNRMSLQG